MLRKFYDIKYECDDKNLPSELIIDLERFQWCDEVPVGLGNLNYKARRAIKEITGCYPISCKLGRIELHEK
ncbi:hypothetical protein EBU95_20225 [bacterium]|nr:hypothetical protein [bacterium]